MKKFIFSVIALAVFAISSFAAAPVQAQFGRFRAQAGRGFAQASIGLRRPVVAQLNVRRPFPVARAIGRAVTFPFRAAFGFPFRQNIVVNSPQQLVIRERAPLVYQRDRAPVIFRESVHYPNTQTAVQAYYQPVQAQTLLAQASYQPSTQNVVVGQLAADPQPEVQKVILKEVAQPAQQVVLREVAVCQPPTQRIVLRQSVGGSCGGTAAFRY